MKIPEVEYSFETRLREMSVRLSQMLYSLISRGLLLFDSRRKMCETQSVGIFPRHLLARDKLKQLNCQPLISFLQVSYIQVNQIQLH